MKPGIVDPPDPEALAFARRFTRLHQETAGCPPRERERVCRAAMLERIFLPPEPGDPFVGRVRYPLVGLSPEPGGLGYYANLAALPPDLAEYWREQTTASRVRQAMPEWVRETLPSDDWGARSGLAFPLYRIAGVQFDLRPVLEHGLHGVVRDELEPVIRRYASQADLPVLELLEGPAKSFWHATQLLWLVSLAAGVWNYGRLDVVLGPYLAKDLDSGVLTETRALEMIQSLWRLMAANDNQYNNRAIVGGLGRPDVASADRFALLAIEATRTVRLNQPQFTLRFHEGQDPELYRRALDCLAEGRTFPILYNDDVNVPAVMQAFGVSRELAEQYLPYGCGEFMLWGQSVSSPNGVINLPMCLLAALETGAESFESLWDAYDVEVTRCLDALAEFQKLEYQIAFQECRFTFLRSLLPNEPIWTAAVETYGNTNTADAFTALCGEDLTAIRSALGEDFTGHEALRQRLLAKPKYGNDDDTADAMAARVHEHVCLRAQQAGQRAGIRQLVVVVNNWANVLLGQHTPATPDGRRAGEAFANANNPVPGMDRQGVTAFLSSLTKLRPDIHACTVQNMKFSKSLFQDRARLEALLSVYWQRGGTQAMITVVDRHDLEAAMREPEKWGHLMVRVGGFSARFIDLPHACQLEILARTLHE